MLLGSVPVGNDGLEPLPVSLIERDGYSCSHAQHSHTKMSDGIPKGTLPFRLYH
jgi:hypothetical protein